MLLCNLEEAKVTDSWERVDLLWVQCGSEQPPLRKQRLEVCKSLRFARMPANTRQNQRKNLKELIQ